jgi:ubiquinone/menaquinone biosynthesis C-methylase UbiE
MLARAEHAGRTAKVPMGVVQGDSMNLPFPDDSFDTVVSSLVLCTVADPRRALAEVRRVLRTGGTLRFYEHVRAAEPRLARWQDRLERPWRWIARGCHPNRDTVVVIEDAGFRVLEVEAFDFSPVPPIVRPHVIGVAARR